MWKATGQQYRVKSRLGILFRTVEKRSQKDSQNNEDSSQWDSQNGEDSIYDILHFSPAHPLAANGLSKEFRNYVEQKTGHPYGDLLLAQLSDWVIERCVEKTKANSPERVYVRVDDPITSIPWEAVFGRIGEDGIKCELPPNLVLYRHSVRSSLDLSYRVGHLAKNPCALYGGYDGSDAPHFGLTRWAACADKPSDQSRYHRKDLNCPVYKSADTHRLPRDCADWRNYVSKLVGHSALLLLAPVTVDGDIHLDRQTVAPSEWMGSWADRDGPVALGVFPYRAERDTRTVPLDQSWVLACGKAGSPVGASPYYPPLEEAAAALGHCFTVGVIDTILPADGDCRLVDICDRAREHAREIGASDLNLVFLFRDDPFKFVHSLPQLWKEVTEKIEAYADDAAKALDDKDTDELWKTARIEVRLTKDEALYVTRVADRSRLSIKFDGPEPDDGSVASASYNDWREALRWIRAKEQG
jgi:hypothetical protein